MTEPNIAYLGDEVRIIEDDYVKDRVFWVVGGECRRVPESLALPEVDQLWLTMHDGRHIPAFEVTTPDGRPVDGFGGAKIEIAGAGTNRWTLLLHRVTLGVNQSTISHSVDLGLQCAIAFYGEWVRKPTEADLKRRGLL